MNINWNDIWKKQLSQSAMPKPDSYAEWWNSIESARNYLKYFRGNSSPENNRIDWTIENLRLKPDSRVLEIGSGPGILAVPIAKKVSHVTVIEPASGMIQALKEYADQEGVSTIHCIQKRWEDVEDTDIRMPYNIVFASMSLAMPEIQAAIEKMNRFSSGTVTLIWFAEEPGFEKIHRMVLPEITGKEFIPGPKADILFNLTYSMGLFPEVNYGKFSSIQKFSNEKEIADFFQSQHHVMYRKESEGFRQYLNENMRILESGFEHEENYHCMILRWTV